MRVEWDWRIVGPRKIGVLLGMHIDATKSKSMNYQIEVRLVGEFTITAEEPSPTLRNFCLYAAPTILFPYLRETITALTQRTALKRPLTIPITNVYELMSGIDFRKANGFQQAAEDPEFRGLVGSAEEVEAG